MKRNWRDARAKLAAENFRCRVCGSAWRVQAAHVIARRADEKRGAGRYVHPDSIVPLCEEHHIAYDSHQLDLLLHLTSEEQERAVRDAGGLELARKRLCPGAYGEREAAAA